MFLTEKEDCCPLGHRDKLWMAKKTSSENAFWRSTSVETLSLAFQLYVVFWQLLNAPLIKVSLVNGSSQSNKLVIGSSQCWALGTGPQNVPVFDRTVKIHNARFS